MLNLFRKDLSKLENAIENNDDKHNIYVNKIIISKNIDNDETSDT